MLRPVDKDSRLLTDEELQARGNELVTLVREAAIIAIGKSMHPKFVQRGPNLQRRDILRWRGKVRDSIAAWREAESHLTELINELDKKDAEFRRTHRPVMKTEDGVHYRTEWVKNDERMADRIYSGEATIGLEVHGDQISFNFCDASVAQWKEPAGALEVWPDDEGLAEVLADAISRNSEDLAQSIVASLRERLKAEQSKRAVLEPPLFELEVTAQNGGDDGNAD